MCATFRDEDVEKRVENANGEPIGTVTTVEGDTAHVDPSPGVVDSIRAALGWRRSREDTVLIHEDAVAEIGDDVIRLETESEGVESDEATPGGPAEPHASSTGEGDLSPDADDPSPSPDADDRGEPRLVPKAERDANRGTGPGTGTPESPGLEDRDAVESPADPGREPDDGSGVDHEPDAGPVSLDESDADVGSTAGSDAEDETTAESNVVEGSTAEPDAVDGPTGESNSRAEPMDDLGSGQEPVDESNARDEADDPDGPAASETNDVADEVDPGVDLDSLEGAGIDDAGASADAGVSADAGETAAPDADLGDALDRGSDLESAVEPDREGTTRTDDADQRLDAEARPQTAADRLDPDRQGTAGRDDESAPEMERSDPAMQTDLEKLDREASSPEVDRDRERDDRESGSRFDALFAPQRAAIRGSRLAFESGLAVQRGTSLGVLEAEKELQRRQLEALRAGTRGTLGVVAAMADAGASDRRSGSRRRVGESGAGGPRGERLELLDGLDATYRERLVDAGIATLDDLAAAEPAAVVDAASVTRERATRWIEQASR